MLKIKPRRGHAESNTISLEKLPDDIMLNIFDAVQELSPEAMPSLALVCSTFYCHARRAQFRDISVDLDSEDVEDRLLFASKNGLLSHIHTLAVKGAPNPVRLAQLGNLIQSMAGLRDVEWRAATIPEPILRSLQDIARIRLHIFVIDNSKQLLTDVASSPILSSLCVKITYKSAQDCLEVTRPLKRVLLSCPNLRNLSLDLSPPHGGCVPFDPPAQYIGLGLSGGERPPALEELEVINYPWGFKCNSPHGVNCIGYPEEGLEMDYWANSFDWSRLRRLAVVSIMLGTKLLPKLTFLKHVRLKYGQGPAEQAFFEQLPSMLESVCVPTLECIGINGILQHGESLRELKIHQTEHNGKWEDSIIPNTILASLCTGLPQLRVLSINADRHGDCWPYEMLDFLAKFPRLRKLELWFALGHARSVPPQPYLTMASASHLIEYLHERSSSIQYLHVHSGTPLQAADFGPVEAYWPSQNSTSFICVLEDTGKNAAQFPFSITCPKLSEEMNIKMQHIVRGEEQRWLPTESRIDFRVALEGPMRVQEWVDWHYHEK